MAQLGQTGETLCNKYLLPSKMSCVKPGHATCFRENNNGRSKWDISKLVNFIKLQNL